jgi:hypothetical protein
MQPLPDRDAPFQQECADLIDDAGALADQSLAHPMQRLQVELLGGLGRHEFHRRTLHRFSNRLRVAIVVLFTFAIWAHVFRRHQPSIVAECLKLATEMMRTDTGLHSDQARLRVGKPHLHLATRPFLSKHDGTVSILADNVERILADTGADYGDCAVECLWHGGLLEFGTPCQLL